MKTRRILSWVLIAVLVLQGCASSSRKSAGESNLLSDFERKELEIGRQIHAQVLSSFYLYTEPHLIEYVNGVGRRMAEQADRKKLNYQFTVLLDDKIFATSAPGGYVYITTGMIDFLDNEAQLAAVLSHEIAQLQYLDPRFSKSHKRLEDITKGGTIVGSFLGNIGVIAIVGLQVMNALTDEKTKDQRVDLADRLTLRYLTAAGYDPECWADALYKMVHLKKDDIVRLFDYYNTRPISLSRLKKIKKSLTKMDLSGKTLETGTEAYEQAVKGVRQIYAVTPAV